MEAVIYSKIGNLKIVEIEDRLTELRFINQPVTRLPNSKILVEVKAQLEEYFTRTRTRFDLPLNPSGTDFQKKVWQELVTIPYGETISYQEMAHRLGDPKCIRAAAKANGQNPIAIVIPCHWVIGAHGEMTGYAGGIHRKEELLALEGAAVMNQLNLF